MKLALFLSTIIAVAFSGCSGDGQEVQQTIAPSQPEAPRAAIRQDVRKTGTKSDYRIIFSDPDCFGGCFDILVKKGASKENIYWIIQNLQEARKKVHLNLAFWNSEKTFANYQKDKPAKMYAYFSTEPDQNALVAAGRRGCNMDCLASKEFTYTLVCPDETTETGKLDALY